MVSVITLHSKKGFSVFSVFLCLLMPLSGEGAEQFAGLDFIGSECASCQPATRNADGSYSITCTTANGGQFTNTISYPGTLGHMVVNGSNLTCSIGKPPQYGPLFSCDQRDADLDKKPWLYADNINGGLGNMACNVPNPTWRLGTITNNSQQHVMFSFHVSEGGTDDSSALDSLTMVGVLMDRDGIIGIDPQGEPSGCTNPAFKTEIEYGEQYWEFYYNVGTTLSFVLNTGQNFQFTPDPTGQVKPGGQPATCK